MWETHWMYLCVLLFWTFISSFFSFQSQLWSAHQDLVWIQVDIVPLSLGPNGDQSVWEGTLKGLCFIRWDRRPDQWDQSSWPRCCWGGWRCVSHQSRWRTVRPPTGMDRSRQAVSHPLWTRERRSWLGAVARRHWEGRHNLLYVCTFTQLSHLFTFV